MFVELDLAEQVAGELLDLLDPPLAVPDLGDLLDRDDDPADELLEFLDLDPPFRLPLIESSRPLCTLTTYHFFWSARLGTAAAVATAGGSAGAPGPGPWLRRGGLRPTVAVDGSSSGSSLMSSPFRRVTNLSPARGPGSP